jgi:hypothetical protein
MKLSVNVKEIKKSAKKLRKVLKNLKSQVETNSLIEKAAEEWKNKAKEEMVTSSTRKECDLTMYLNQKHGADPTGRPPLDVTGTLKHNLIHWYDGMTRTYKIGFCRDLLEFPVGGSFWARKEKMIKGVQWQKARTAEDGLMITAATLEYGSNRIHVPINARIRFKIKQDYFTIPPRLFLTSTFSKDNRHKVRKIIIRYLKNELKKL